MQETNEMRDRLVSEFAENYMEKLFYFCLKKTGRGVEAEDLTQDITLQIITALNKGTLPTSFSAWIWQIARNRYSVWAKEKHDRNESVTGSDIIFIYPCLLFNLFGDNRDLRFLVRLLLQMHFFISFVDTEGSE